MNLLLLAATVTTLVAGHPVSVGCKPIGAHAGYYEAPRDIIWLDPGTCNAFTSTRPERRAHAIFTLVHEAVHASRRYAPDDEHATDCAALSLLPGVLRAIAFQDVALALRVAREIHESYPAPYSGAC